MASIWWSNINIIYCEEKRWVLSPVAAALHLGRELPLYATITGEKPGTLLHQGVDAEKDKISILLHGGYLPFIKNFVFSLTQKSKFIPLDALYTPRLQAGLFLLSFHREKGDQLIQLAVKEILPQLLHRINDRRA